MNPKIQAQTIHALMANVGHHGEYLAKVDEAIAAMVRTVKDLRDIVGKLEERVAQLEAAKPAEPADDA